MKKMKKILVPVDGSEVCERAVSYAKILAKKFGSKVILLNIAAVPSAPVYYGNPRFALEPRILIGMSLKLRLVMNPQES